MFVPGILIYPRISSFTSSKSLKYGTISFLSKRSSCGIPFSSGLMDGPGVISGDGVGCGEGLGIIDGSGDDVSEGFSEAFGSSVGTGSCDTNSGGFSLMLFS